MIYSRLFRLILSLYNRSFKSKERERLFHVKLINKKEPAEESPYSENPTGSVWDSDLICRCINEKAALEQLYIMYKSDVFAFSFSLYNNRTVAEDCVQETFIRLPSAAAGYKAAKSGSCLPFILGIAKNVSRELYRSEVKFRAGAVKMEAQNPLDFAPQSGILELVRTLPAKYRTVLMLKAYSDMTFKEMSAVMKLPESTVKSRFSRAAAMLSRLYGSESEHNGDNGKKDNKNKSGQKENKTDDDLYMERGCGTNVDR